jgi:hypothetical protein
MIVYLKGIIRAWGPLKRDLIKKKNIGKDIRLKSKGVYFLEIIKREDRKMPKTLPKISPIPGIRMIVYKQNLSISEVEINRYLALEMTKKRSIKLKKPRAIPAKRLDFKIVS